MKIRLCQFSLLAFMCASSALFAHDAKEVKADTLRQLKDLRSQNISTLRQIDESLAKKMDEVQTQNLESDVRTLLSAKHEHVLRQQFLDRLIFQIDTKFNGLDLRGFLENSLKDMAKVDAMNAATDSQLWKFMRFAADAVRSLPDRKENVLSFLEGYMKRSVANPMKPTDYLNSRNYTNGVTSESGTPVSREDVGALADRRLQELNARIQESERPQLQDPSTGATAELQPSATIQTQ